MKYIEWVPKPYSDNRCNDLQVKRYIKGLKKLSKEIPEIKINHNYCIWDMKKELELFK